MSNDDRTLTVGELIEQLSRFPAETPVRALWDCTPRFSVHRVKPFEDTALIDCGSGPGDWFTIAGDIRDGRLPGRLSDDDARELDEWLDDKA
jgi:hypothetical protein